MIKKILLITIIIFVFTINNTNAWLGLTAQNGDLLNISKWNELITKLTTKLEQSNILGSNNIEVNNSGTGVIISLTGSVSASSIPYITSGNNIINTSTTIDINITGLNFVPNTDINIPNFQGTINSINVYNPTNLSINITTNSNTGTYDIVLSNNGVLNTSWSNNGVGLLIVNDTITIVGDNSIGRKWSNGTFATTCNEYKNPNTPYEYSGDIGDGIYWIKPDNNPEFKVYCDMTTSGGGWTKFVDIKGNYTIQNAIDCWKGTNISNANLECFNPNRYGISINTLMNIDWSGNYSYSIIDSNPSTTTTSSSNQRKCLGHDEYMTIMRSDQTPQSDGSDASYVRLGRSFCKYGREPAGIGGQYMNYDSNGEFGESNNAGRESSAKNTKIYFR